MKRALCSSAQGCRSKCLYCFATFPNLTKLPSFIAADPGATVIYPSCDSEFSRSSAFVQSLREFAKGRARTIYSLSTKNALSDDYIQELSDLHEWLLENDRGFIKIGVSFTTKNRIPEIEPLTLSYEARVSLTERISRVGLPCSINMKPILPFVALEEYESIVLDTLGLGKPYLIGGLYVDLSSVFYEKYIRGRYDITWRKVEWLPGTPSWPYVEDPNKMQAIAQTIQKSAGEAFFTDLDVLLRLAAVLPVPTS